MAWWDNLWLNEGFASWMGTKCLDHFNPQWHIWLRSNADRDVSSTGNPARVFLIEQKSATLPNTQSSQNVKLNAGDVGYFRTQYNGPHFEKLLALVAQLPEADKVNLISDAWALVQADRGSISDYFKLVEDLREDNSLALWEQITATLSAIDFLYLGNGERAAFQAYGRSLLKPVFDRLGWEPKKGEEVTTGLLRTKLITELSEFGDEDVIASARERFKTFVADPNTLPPDL